MSGPAAMPVFGDAYLADTQHLTLEEHGAYFKLLLCAWRTPLCELPADDRRIATMLGVSSGKWAKLKPVILAFWSRTETGWQQKRLTKERIFVEEKSSKNQANIKAYWERKRLENNKSVDTNEHTNDDAPPPPPPHTTFKEDDVEGAREAESPPSDAINLTAEVCRLAGIRHVDPGHIVSRVPVIREWLQAGADPPLILATVRDLNAATNEPIRSLNYIDPHIRKAITRKENPNAQSTATGQFGRSAAPPTGRTATVLKLLAEVRANAPADQPGDNGIAGRIGHALP